MQLIKALLAQSIGAATVFLLLQVLAIPILWAALLQGAASALASRLLRQPSWWIPMHLLFMPAALVMLHLQLPAWSYLLAASILLLVFWGTIKGDVPLFLSSPAVSHALSEILDREQASAFIDLGAGIGSVTLPLALRYPQVHVEAWEHAPIPWLVARWRSRHLPNCRVIRQSFWDCDLSVYDVVYAFLSPFPMPQLGEKVRSEMRPASLLVSSSFPIPGWEPESVIPLEDRMHTTLYCYRIPS